MEELGEGSTGQDAAKPETEPSLLPNTAALPVLSRVSLQCGRSARPCATACVRQEKPKVDRSKYRRGHAFAQSREAFSAPQLQLVIGGLAIPPTDSAFKNGSAGGDRLADRITVVSGLSFALYYGPAPYPVWAATFARSGFLRLSAAVIRCRDLRRAPHRCRAIEGS